MIVEAALALGGVAEVAIPVGRWWYVAVRRDVTGGNAVVRPPDQRARRRRLGRRTRRRRSRDAASGSRGRRKTAATRSVTGVAGPSRSRASVTTVRGAPCATTSPARSRAVRQSERPRRPRLGGERPNAACAVGVDDVGRVALRRQRERVPSGVSTHASKPLTSTMRPVGGVVAASSSA